MKAAILTCSNALGYLKANICSCLGEEVEIAEHRRNLKEKHYDIIILACDHAGLEDPLFLEEKELGASIIDLRFLDKPDIKDGISSEEIRKEIIKGVFKYFLSLKPTWKLLSFLMNFSQETE